MTAAARPRRDGGAAPGRIPDDVVQQLQDDCDLLGLVEAAAGKLRKTGREYRGWCPICDGADKLTVYRKAGRWRWKCFGCEAYGGPIEWLKRVGGLGFLDAVARLGGDVVELRRVGVSPEVAARSAAKRAEREARERAESAERRRAAWAVWDGADELPGTAGESYLEGRGLRGPWPASLRFHPRVWTVKPDPLPGDAHHEVPVALPALVACVTSGDFKFLAVHRIFLGGDPAGSGRVVQAPSLPERSRKRALGDLADGWVRLTAVPEAGAQGGGGVLAVTEGIETGLAVVHALRHAGRLFGEGGDVIVGAALFAGQLAKIGLPGSRAGAGSAGATSAGATSAGAGSAWRPDRIVVMADNDPKSGTGAREAIAACQRAEREFGIPAAWAMPDVPGWDWNDPLMKSTGV